SGGLLPQGGPSLLTRRTSLKSKRATMKFFGPTASISSTTLLRIPWIMALIAMTVATPTTMPRIVSPERNLLARIWSRARTAPSRKLSMRMLFRPQCNHGIQPRRPRRRVDAGNDAHAHAHEHGHAHPERRDGRRQGRDGLNDLGQ